jgi:hypothetical protein
MKKTSRFEAAEDRFDEYTYEPDLYIAMCNEAIILRACISFYQNDCTYFRNRRDVDGFIESLIEARDIVFNEKEER